MQLPLVLMSILGLAAATPVDFVKFKEALLIRDVSARNSALETLVLNLLEDLRQTMLTGSDDVPILDPFELESLNLNDEILPLPGFHIDIKDLKVSKLSTFVVDKMDINLASIIPIPLRYRIDFDLHVPVLDVDAANYDVSVSAMGTNIFGNGDAKINLIEPRVTGSLVVGPRVTLGSGIYLQITSSNVKLSLKGFEPQINGLMNDAAMSEFINTFLKHLVPEALEMYEDDITTFLSNTVLEVGNELLADLNLIGILG